MRLADRQRLLLDAVERNDETEVSRITAQLTQDRLKNFCDVATASHEELRAVIAELDLCIYVMSPALNRDFQSLVNGRLDLSDDLLARLATAPTRRHALKILLTEVSSLIESTAVQSVASLRTRGFSNLIDEYAACRNAIESAWYSQTIEQDVADERLVLEMRTGAGSGLRMTMFMIEIYPQIARACGIEPTPDGLVYAIGDGTFLRGLARQSGVAVQAFERIASGCTSDCFGSEETVRRLSPHVKWLDHYESSDAFRAQHWHHMWYGPELFRMIRVDNQLPDIGLDFGLMNAIDPLDGTRVAELEQRHTRMGCPILAYDGIVSFARWVAELCCEPVIWNRLVEQTTH